MDGSCRREPDLEHPFPSISAVCRGALFAPRLHPGDRVVYVTVRGHHPTYANGRERRRRDAPNAWRLVALVEVLHRFDSHNAAACWYRAAGVRLPNNCLVDGNPPKPYHLTSRRIPARLRQHVSPEENPAGTVRLWDAGYRRRVAAHPTFLVCRPIYIALWDPPVVTAEMMRAILGRLPATRTPPRIDAHAFLAFARVAGVA